MACGATLAKDEKVEARLVDAGAHVEGLERPLLAHEAFEQRRLGRGVETKVRWIAGSSQGGGV